MELKQGWEKLTQGPRRRAQSCQNEGTTVMTLILCSGRQQFWVRAREGSSHVVTLWDESWEAIYILGAFKICTMHLKWVRLRLLEAPPNNERVTWGPAWVLVYEITEASALKVFLVKCYQSFSFLNLDERVVCAKKCTPFVWYSFLMSFNQKPGNMSGHWQV